LFQRHAEFTVCGEAVNGVDALSKAQELSPDLIILDLVMPEMNGLEAATALYCMMPAVPIFLLTAHYTRELELAALQSGVCAVFAKYDDPRRLVDRARVELKLKPSDDTDNRQESEETPGDLLSLWPRFSWHLSHPRHRHPQNRPNLVPVAHLSR
jgi:DNA-binding NarL/FixJ family response regulator